MKLKKLIINLEKKRVLDDHLAREEFIAKVRMMNRNHVDKHDKLQSWITEKENYLKTKEAINSISEAKTQLSLLETYEGEKVLYSFLFFYLFSFGSSLLTFE